MADSTFREEIDNVWASLETDEETPNTPEMAVVADDEPEAIAEAPKAEAASAEPTIEAAPALTQDERGRFHRPDGTIASKDEVEVFKAGRIPAEPVAAAVVTQPEVQASEAPPATPFRYRAVGQTLTLEGATEDKDGNVIYPGCPGRGAPAPPAPLSPDVGWAPRAD